MLKKLLGYQLYTVGNTTVRYLRSNKPIIKISEEAFQLTINLKDFTLDELTVKAHPEYVIIEGKHEKDTDAGLMIKQFTRKFRLPKGCNPKKVESKFSVDGILTITALRAVNGSDTSDMVEVPISADGVLRGRKSKESKVYEPYCKTYPKVKSIPPPAAAPKKSLSKESKEQPKQINEPSKPNKEPTKQNKESQKQRKDK